MANTSRSRCYLSEMIRQNLLPDYIIYLPGDKASKLGKADHSYNHNHDSDWPEADFDANIDLQDLLIKINIDHAICDEDINSESVAKLMSDSGIETFVYSGFGGIIVKEIILELGLNLLHIHGGYLPEFKGSTTNYFSILSEKSIGASAIFLSKDLDSGPMIARLKAPEPKHKIYLDHIYDSAVRARMLIKALNILKNNKFKNQPNNKNDQLLASHYYYIIHPVLKHISIMS